MERERVVLFSIELKKSQGCCWPSLERWWCSCAQTAARLSLVLWKLAVRYMSKELHELMEDATRFLGNPVFRSWITEVRLQFAKCSCCL